MSALFPRLHAPRSVTTIKHERSTTVEVLAFATQTIVRKVYRNRRALLWRTWLTRSRAAREFENLARVRAAGVPCVEPLAWDERRCCGWVLESALLTRFVADAPSLKQALRDPQRARSRRALAESLGATVRRLHAGGVLGCRITPRNFLVVGRAQLLLLDLPAAIPFARPILRTRRARLDLFDAAFSVNRKKQLTRAERLRVVRAYCEGDRAAARAHWRKLARRWTWWNQLGKAALVAWFGYVVPALRRGRRPEPMRDFVG